MPRRADAGTRPGGRGTPPPALEGFPFPPSPHPFPSALLPEKTKKSGDMQAAPCPQVSRQDARPHSPPTAGEKKTCLLHEKTLMILFAAEVVELVDTLS